MMIKNVECSKENKMTGTHEKKEAYSTFNSTPTIYLCTFSHSQLSTVESASLG